MANQFVVKEKRGGNVIQAEWEPALRAAVSQRIVLQEEVSGITVQENSNTRKYPFKIDT